MILCLHRVLEQPDPLARDTPTALEFREQISWLKKFCTILPLSEGVMRLRAQSLPANALCITFDDGYLDNLTVAGPILQEMETPATLFVTTEPLRAGIMWNDLIIEAIRSSQSNVAHALSEIENEITKHKYLHWRDRWEKARAFYASRCPNDPDRLMLKPEQLKAVVDCGFEIGAHTINHPILRTLTDTEAESEIVGSADELESMTGTRPTLFAYPNGRLGDDYDVTHREIVRKSGFQAAVATNWGAAAAGDSLFELPRFLPWERSEFSYGLRLVKTLIRS